MAVFYHSVALVECLFLADVDVMHLCSRKYYSHIFFWLFVAEQYVHLDKAVSVFYKKDTTRRPKSTQRKLEFDCPETTVSEKTA